MQSKNQNRVSHFTKHKEKNSERMESNAQTHIIGSQPNDSKKFYSLKPAIEYATEAKHHLVLGFEKKNAKKTKIVRGFQTAKSWQHFFQTYQAMQVKNYYEMIRYNLSQKLHLDLEHYAEDIFTDLPLTSKENKALELLDSKALASVTFFLEKFLLEIGRADIDLKDCLLLSASTFQRQKTSCHIIFQNAIFPDCAHLHRFMEEFVAFLEHFEPSSTVELELKNFLYCKEMCVIDQSIYHRDAANTRAAQNLRLIGSWKFEQSPESRLMILDPETSTKKATFTQDEFYQSLVQVPFTEEQLEKAIHREIPLHYAKMSSKRATTASKSSAKNVKSSSLTLSTKDDENDDLDDERYDSETLDEIIQLITPALEEHGIPRTLIKPSQSKINYIYIHNAGNVPRKCPLSENGSHIKNNASVRIQPNGDTRYYCFGSECKGRYLDLKVNVSKVSSTKAEITTPTTTSTTASPLILEEHTPQSHPIVSKMNQFRMHPLIEHRKVNVKYINEAMKQDDPLNSAETQLLCILSPTGSGKTTYAQQMFKESLANDPKSVCVALSPRRSVTSQHEKNFKEMGFIHYMKDKKLLPTCNRIISTLDSLFKIDKAIDILYIDEVESLLEHVFADTLKERNLVWSKLLQVCSTAKKVVVTDADFGDLSTTFFTEVIEADQISQPVAQKHRTVFLENIKNLDPIDITLASTNSQWFVELEKTLRDPASKIFIGCDSKRDAQNIREKIIAWLGSASLDHQNLFSAQDVLLYTSKDGDCSDLSNADDAWKDAKVVICSPTIIYGVDYNNKEDPFTAVMGYYTQQGFTMGADKIRQQLRRARNIAKPNSQAWHMCIYIFQNPKQSHLKQFYPTDASTVLLELEQTCRAFSSIISKLPIPVTTNIHGQSTIVSDPLSRLYVEFLRKRNVSKFSLSTILQLLLTFEGHHVVTMPFEKLKPHPIWNSERFMVDVFQREQKLFADGFDLLALEKAQLALKRNSPFSDDTVVTSAVEVMRDLLGIHDFTDTIIQNIKSSPFLMQFIQNPKLQAAVFKFQRLLRKSSRFVAIEDAHPNSPIKITMSEKYLLDVLTKVEEVMQLKRFECLYLTQSEVRLLHGERIQVESDLLTLMQNVGKYHFLPTSEVAFKKTGESITKYHLYQWICKIYSYFCSVTNKRNGNKKRIIKSKSAPVLCKNNIPKSSKMKNEKNTTNDKNTTNNTKDKDNTNNTTEKYCDYCHTSKNIENDFHKGNRFCRECSHEFQHYFISKDSQFSLVQLLQFCFFFCQFRNYGALEMTFRLTDDIVTRNLNDSIDLTMSSTFQTENCQILQDVIHDYQNHCSIIFQEEQ